MALPASDVTLLLSEVRAGEAGSWNRLFARIYDELKGMAHRELSRERPGHMLQTTALVNEAFLRLVGGKEDCWENRAHFFAVAATAMRRILVEEARRRKARKRGGNAGAGESAQTTDLLNQPAAAEEDPFLDVEALDRALDSFARDVAHQQKCRVIELRFFVGLTIEETADVLDVSVATVKRDWEFARAWLRREIGRAMGPRP